LETIKKTAKSFTTCILPIVISSLIDIKSIRNFLYGHDRKEHIIDVPKSIWNFIEVWTHEFTELAIDMILRNEGYFWWTTLVTPRTDEEDKMPTSISHIMVSLHMHSGWGRNFISSDEIARRTLRGKRVNKP